METNLKSKITGLLLCAGLSGRMGTLKSLMIYDKLPFAIHIIKKLLLVCNEVIVVTGHESVKVVNEITKYLSAIENALVRFVFNDNYNAGMFSSLQCGLKNLSQSGWILYHFVDQPSIPPKFYADFTSNIKQDLNWLQPSFNNKLGHPILFNNLVAGFVLELERNKSLRHLNEDNRIIRQIWHCNYPEVLQDIDTNEQYFNLTIQQ